MFHEDKQRNISNEKTMRIPAKTETVLTNVSKHETAASLHPVQISSTLFWVLKRYLKKLAICIITHNLCNTKLYASNVN